MKDIYKIKAEPMAVAGNMVKGDKYRITVLTDGLLRLEYCKDGKFEDRPTQVVLNRNFEKTDFRVWESLEQIEIITKRVHLIYNKGEFSKSGLTVHVLGNISTYRSVWNYSEDIHDLGGTARTLDGVDGQTGLEHGILSRYGYSVLDDSGSLAITEDGWVAPRDKEKKDIYFFGYGQDYFQCLDAFYHLCGKCPMLPRFALGNWWSRYFKYSEETYMELMDRFCLEELPFTVAVIDMDWHLVDIDPKYGSGWTGYTWNRELFPDPAGFLDKLHKRGMKTTLNVHPADGIRAYEDAYEDIAKVMGVDIKEEDPVLFDVSDPKFMEAYFECVHHPLEEEGVDFWWIDWQQGGTSRIEGLDPLWMLNHYHFLDSGRSGRRPMTFSRYAGPGSHRYPAGFSGDTVTTWESLDFQPYFTANASNIGYGWWSHDIGGHMQGYKNDEMAGRWVQYGVFSPIMRLHSTNGLFNGKEPWRFKEEIRCVMGEFLRLRHRLVPYLYTMNYRSYKENKPLISPMYYFHPGDDLAYQVPNQYYFGQEMIVAPITAKRLSMLNVAKVKAWLPQGIYIDFFTGLIYSGGRRMELYRDINTIPVLARAGAVIPLTDCIKGEEVSGNPGQLRIRVFAGADGSFTLYEDDNSTLAYEKGVCVKTAMNFVWGREASFTIERPEGELSLLPEKRQYVVEFTGVIDQEAKAVFNGKTLDICKEYDSKSNTIKVTLPFVDSGEKIKITFEGELSLAENKVKEMAFDFLNQAEIGFDLKEELYALISSEKKPVAIIGEMKAMGIDGDLMGVLMEFLTAWQE